MNISYLTEILPEPTSPKDTSSKRVWQKIDDKINFPSDYVEFINNYGTGRIAQFIAIFNPFSENENVNFFEQKKIY